MRRDIPDMEVFEPCDDCAAREVLSNESTLVSMDFGIALRELKRRNRGHEQGNRPAPVGSSDINQVAERFDLGNHADLLGKCFAARASGSCAGDTDRVADVKVNNEIL